MCRDILDATFECIFEHRILPIQYHFVDEVHRDRSNRAVLVFVPLLSVDLPAKK